MADLKAIKKLTTKKMSLEVICLGMVMFCLSCTRDEEDLPAAPFDDTPEVFTDDFVDLGSDFYFPYAEAKPDVFSVDEEEGYESEASIRIDVPNADDPGGSFAGAIFRIDGAGRNLTDYNALSFWAKASQAATVGEVGFGQDFLGDTFRAYLSDVDFTPNWEKIVIPIPDPSKLLQERGVFQFSAKGIGEVAGQEVGYTFWVDELTFEDLATVAQPIAQIFDGNDEVETTFNGGTITITGKNVIYNVDGIDVTVNAASAYYNFTSSNPAVASVNDDGIVTMNTAGTAVITAMLNTMEADGSLTITSNGDFEFAPTPPTRNETDIVSVLSDAYTNVLVDNYNGFFGGQTTQGGFLEINGEGLLSYTDLNFVTISLSGTVDVSEMSFLHVDIQVNGSLDAADILTVEIIDFGTDGSFDGPSGGDTGGGTNIDSERLESNSWVSLDLPVDGFTDATGGGYLGNPSLTNIAQVSFVSGNISAIYVDNIYFYRE
ncbi:MAG: hypothetical protein AAGI25_14465 [Bacteroidota bacterium]